VLSIEWKPDGTLGGNVKESLRSNEFHVLMTTLKAAREDAGLSQRQVAKGMGLYATAYGRFERGDRVLDVVEFVALADAIGRDPLALFADFLLGLQKERLRAGERVEG